MIPPHTPFMTRQFQQIALLLISPKTEETSLFYSKISQVVSKVNLGSSPAHPKNNVKMVLSSSTLPTTGFAFITDKELSPRQSHDPDGRPIHICSKNSGLFSHTLDMAGEPIAILRSSGIDVTKGFYAQYGECVEEQHGKGPRHYSISWMNGPITEIYPRRKICAGNFEFLFQSSNISLTAQEIDRQGLYPFSAEEKSISLHDPDGRLVRIISL